MQAMPARPGVPAAALNSDKLTAAEPNPAVVQRTAQPSDQPWLQHQC
jgi:hypothetical protein